MKTLGALVLMFVLMAFAVPKSSSAQTAWGTYNATKAEVGNDAVLVFTGTINSTDSLYSNSFEISKFNDVSFNTYPLSYQFILIAGTGKQKISSKILGAFKDSKTLSDWTVIDTTMNADSVTTPTQKDINLNNKHYPYYKILFHGASGNGTGTQFQGRYYLWKKE
jgi:uncharacterized protein RhaS with RHS repeats